MANKIVIAFGFLIAALLVFYFGTWNFYRMIGDTAKKIDVARQRLAEAQKTAPRLQEMQDRARSNEAAISKLNSLFLKSANKEDIVLLAKELAEKQGMVFVDLNLGEKMSAESPAASAGRGASASSAGVKTEGQPALKLLPLSLKVGGTYESFKTFLDALQHNLPLISVQSFSIESPQRVEDYLFLFELNLGLYSED